MSNGEELTAGHSFSLQLFSSSFLAPRFRPPSASPALLVEAGGRAGTFKLKAWIDYSSSLETKAQKWFCNSYFILTNWAWYTMRPDPEVLIITAILQLITFTRCLHKIAWHLPRDKQDYCKPDRNDTTYKSPMDLRRKSADKQALW